MSKKQKILFLALILFFGQVFPEIISGQTTNLEVLYPEIFEEVPRPGVSLPKYIDYIYRFAVTIIGLVIFGVLIYSGFSYLLSAGNPERLSEAKKGILAGFLGGIILLSAVLIFNTLSPHLHILSPPLIGELPEEIPSGVHICNHRVDNIEGILNKYLTGDKKTKKEAVQDYIKAIFKGLGNYCTTAKSGKTKIGEIKTMFVVPEKKYSWEYTEAIIIKKEVETTGTDCQIFPEPQNDKIFRSQVLHGSFKVNEIFRIKKHSETGKVVLYEGVARNTMGKYKKDADAGLKAVTYKPDEVKVVTKADLEAAQLWKKTNLVKSIEIDPQKKYIVVLKAPSTGVEISDESDMSPLKPGPPLCEIIDETENNLGAETIGRCGDWCEMRTKVKNFEEYSIHEIRALDEYCYSCFDQLIIIKGSMK